MEQKDLKKIAMFCLIGGIVLCAFSQIVPWGNFEVTSSGSIFGEVPLGSVTFYSWGMHESSSDVNEWMWYYQFLSEVNKSKYFGSFLDFIHNYFGSGEYSNMQIPIFFSFLVMPVSILGIVLAIVDYVYLKRSLVRWGLVSGISIALAIVFFYIFIQFGLISSNAMISSYYQYTTGFYLMILSAVLFFSAYLITGIGKEND